MNLHQVEQMMTISNLIFFKDFIYSWETQKEREAETEAEEKQSPCREPDVGLKHRIPGSLPEPKVGGAQLLSHSGVPSNLVSVQLWIVNYSVANVKKLLVFRTFGIWELW